MVKQAQEKKEQKKAHAAAPGLKPTAVGANPSSISWGTYAPSPIPTTFPPTPVKITLPPSPAPSMNPVIANLLAEAKQFEDSHTKAPTPGRGETYQQMVARVHAKQKLAHAKTEAVKEKKEVLITKLKREAEMDKIKELKREVKQKEEVAKDKAKALWVKDREQRVIARAKTPTKRCAIFLKLCKDNHERCTLLEARCAAIMAANGVDMPFKSLQTKAPTPVAHTHAPQKIAVPVDPAISKLRRQAQVGCVVDLVLRTGIH